MMVVMSIGLSVMKMSVKVSKSSDIGVINGSRLLKSSTISCKWAVESAKAICSPKSATNCFLRSDISFLANQETAIELATAASCMSGNAVNGPFESSSPTFSLSSASPSSINSRATSTSGSDFCTKSLSLHEPSSPTSSLLCDKSSLPSSPPVTPKSTLPDSPTSAAPPVNPKSTLPDSPTSASPPFSKTSFPPSSPSSSHDSHPDPSTSPPSSIQSNSIPYSSRSSPLTYPSSSIFLISTKSSSGSSKKSKCLQTSHSRAQLPR
mmetsp:Transcript_16763/g.68579  ORF Transcript_16763/g.68579 Transcript_16763/m.68579 type:complete len:265 (-) Transcript_16763:136-930(-)